MVNNISKDFSNELASHNLYISNLLSKVYFLYNELASHNLYISNLLSKVYFLYHFLTILFDVLS